MNGNKVGDVDWFFISDGTPIYLEAKFKPTDCMRNPDCGGNVVDEDFFGKIGHKFPTRSLRFVPPFLDSSSDKHGSEC